MTALSGQCQLLYFDLDYFPVLEPQVRNKLTTVLEEPFFGFGGMSYMMPSDIFPIVSYLPPFTQDYDIRMTQKALVKQESTLGTLEIKPTGSFSMEVRSIDGFNQMDKQSVRIICIAISARKPGHQSCTFLPRELLILAKKLIFNYR